MVENKSVGIAKFNQSYNDLSWEYWCDICMSEDLEKWLQCKNRRVSWNGYDDRYWWDNVSKVERSTIRETQCGKKLRIEHRGYVSEEVFGVK